MRTLAILVLFMGGAGICAAQQPQESVPTVVSALVPIYPTLARKVGIEGVVHLRVSTDGRQVTEVNIVSGPAMLAVAARDNVKTWRFEEHKPTSFETTFRYNLLPYEHDCDPHDLPDDGKTLLRLPKEAELTARGMGRCNPSVDLTKPATVNLIVKLNGKTIAPPKLVTLTAGNHSLRIPVQDGRFVVPVEFLQAKSVTFEAVIGEDQIRLSSISGEGFTAEDWTLVLADRQFSNEFDWGNHHGNVRSMCALQFGDGDGVEIIETGCRSRIRK